MSRKTRVYIGVVLMVLFSLGVIAYGAFRLVSPSAMYESIHRFNPEYTGYPHVFPEDVASYAFIVVGIFSLLLTPLLVLLGLRGAAKQDDMDAMLKEYRQRKKQNHP